MVHPCCEARRERQLGFAARSEEHGVYKWQIQLRRTRVHSVSVHRSVLGCSRLASTMLLPRSCHALAMQRHATLMPRHTSDHTAFMLRHTTSRLPPSCHTTPYHAHTMPRHTALMPRHATPLLRQSWQTLAARSPDSARLCRTLRRTAGLYSKRFANRFILPNNAKRANA